MSWKVIVRFRKGWQTPAPPSLELTFPPDWSSQWMEQLAEGMEDATEVRSVALTWEGENDPRL